MCLYSVGVCCFLLCHIKSNINQFDLWWQCREEYIKKFGMIMISVGCCWVCHDSQSDCFSSLQYFVIKIVIIQAWVCSFHMQDPSLWVKLIVKFFRIIYWTHSKSNIRLFYNKNKPNLSWTLHSCCLSDRPMLQCWILVELGGMSQWLSLVPKTSTPPPDFSYGEYFLQRI